VKRAAHAFFRGGASEYQNAATSLVVEFVERKRLAELGFTTDLGKMPSWKTDAFIVISLEQDRAKAEAEQKARDKGAKNGRRARRRRR
jgi:hypothetical protein